MTTSNVTQATQGLSLKDQISQQNFLKDAEQKFLNLGTSNRDVINMMTSAITDPNANPATIQFLQMLLDLRRQMVETISNLLKTISDTMRSVIQNYRS